MKVAITGAGSAVARSVIGLLDRDPAVDSLPALDIRPYAGVPSPKLRFFNADVRDAGALRSAFSGADAVIHLAFVVVPAKLDWAEVREVNIEGSRNVLRAAAEAGVGKIVYTSSVAAYGAVPGNPRVLTEDAPLRGLENRKNFYYGYCKAAVEQDMDDFAARHPDLLQTRFRSHVLAGPNILEHTRNLSSLAGLAGPSRSYWAFRAAGEKGRLIQYTHEEDLARAISYALHNDLPGAFNIAGEPLDIDAYLRERGKVFRPIPRDGARALAVLVAPFWPRARVARAWLVSAKYRNILDCSKLEHSEFGARLRTTRECVDEAVAYFERRREAR